jgi:hypothetical protein
MHRLLRTTFILSVNIIYFSSFAQREEHQFGEITHDEVAMTAYVDDQDAGAVVPFDHGKSVFVRDEFGSSAYIINFKRVKRIKIFDKSEYDQANIEIPYYTDGYGKTEKVFNIKAIAYNNENGFLKKGELDPKSIFTEKTNDYWSKKKFAIPNVKEGSIIEFSYELNTPFRFNMPDWKFQSTIPTIYSEYEVRMIPFYEYVFLLQGINKFNYQNSYVDNVSRKLGSIEFTDYIHQYVLKDIPAFRDESYISSIDDYILKMDFQMAKIHSQSGSTTEIMTTWAKLNKSLLKHEKFGKYIAGSKKVVEKNILGTFDLADKNSRQKSKLLIEFMKNKFSWNGNYGKYSTKKAKDFFEDKKGNTSDMNLFLIALLQAHGLEAVPVLISTRDHGKINADYPFDHFL